MTPETPSPVPRTAPPPRRHASAPKPKAGWAMAMRLLARRLHFLAGIIVAPFLLLSCLTGLVYAFSPQIHDDLYQSQLYVSQPHEGAPRPVSEQVTAALAAHPEGALRSVITPSTSDRTTRVNLAVPGLRGAGDEAQSRAVFVDPYTNFITGELTTVGDHLPANTWLRQLHSDLQLGEPGRIYAELSATWLPLIVVGGLVLWLAQPRRRKRVSTRQLLVPSTRGAKEGWGRLRAVHGPLGLWLALGLLVVSVTGLTMSQFAGGRASQATDPLRLHAPSLVAAPVPAAGEPIGIDRVLDVAGAEGLGGELLVTAPSGVGQVYTVAEHSTGLPVHRGAVAIDPYTAHITERIGWGDYSVAAKVTTYATEFHTGTLFGMANQILVAVLAAGLAVLILLGYRMWWVKNPYKSKWTAIPPPVWRQLPNPVLALVLLVVAALGWLLPVFGVSLLVFLALDALITKAKRRRVPAPRDVPR
ncbi:PepSY-associated TM helix domain-containing protein [Amycolatopsis pithecellobii]|uniref:PepSY domain-containing protein n=1 Tax=Amycolatopsis pithecellobii TaxID=664692 RepID=A0A6N7YTI7_9PSEU|nr:PepSY domain-containing protein [Amycolatopsis pithecellobii]MTD56345.1 PepSY domain-containing protein [Amycolatopsis pithecellobii]